jgi:hypothetical protein
MNFNLDERETMETMETRERSGTEAGILSICLRAAGELGVGAAAVYGCWQWFGWFAAALVSAVALLLVLIKEGSAAIDVAVAPRPMKRRFVDTQPLAPSRSAVVQSEWHIDPDLCVLVDDPPLHPDATDEKEGASANESERRTA